ncbi:hypothetical protein V8B97DRAFT_81281 [Scleroderma yunnanense]
MRRVAQPHLILVMNPAEQSVRATKRYQMSLPYTLLSVSPSLAALHVSRFRNLYPETADILDCSHCKQCGAYVFDGQGSTHIMRQKRKNKRSKSPSPLQRVCRRACHMCGFTVDTPFSSTAPSPSRPPPTDDPETLKTDMSRLESLNSSKHGTPSTSKPIPALSPASQSTRQPPSNVKKSKPKMTRTLQDMLEHDRRREEVRKARSVNENQGGLAAFLKDL